MPEHCVVDIEDAEVYIIPIENARYASILRRRMHLGKAHTCNKWKLFLNFHKISKSLEIRGVFCSWTSSVYESLKQFSFVACMSFSTVATVIIKIKVIVILGLLPLAPSISVGPCNLTKPLVAGGVKKHGKKLEINRRTVSNQCVWNCEGAIWPFGLTACKKQVVICHNL